MISSHRRSQSIDHYDTTKLCKYVDARMALRFVDGNAEPMNNSGSQGWLFYQQATWDSVPSPVINAVANCNGPEGVYGTNATAYDGIPGNVGTLLTTDMKNSCKPRH